MIYCNGHGPLEPGCYVAGHHGQYALDAMAEMAEVEFGIQSQWDVRKARFIAEEGDLITGWDIYHDTADNLLDELNEHTTGGYWQWEDGELFLIQTTINATMFVIGADEWEAREILLDKGGAALVAVDLAQYEEVFERYYTGKQSIPVEVTIHLPMGEE